jgi:hypothetical protein
MPKRQPSHYRQRELTLVSILARDDDRLGKRDGGGFRIWVYVRRISAISGEALCAERRLAPDSRAVPLVGDVM